MRNFTYTDIIDFVILDTGLSRKTVDEIVVSFLSHLQEKSVEGDVTVKGFGVFSTRVTKRRYFDINRRVTDDRSVSTKIIIRFTPSVAYTRMVAHHAKENLKDHLIGERTQEVPDAQKIR